MKTRQIPLTSGEKVFCSRIDTETVLADHPLATALGRRGCGAVIDALRAASEAINLRGLARAARVPVANTRRIVRDLEALRLVESIRPGRDARIRWRGGPLAAVLDGWPDLREATADAFSRAYDGPGGAQRWQHPDDDPADPHAPTRIVVLADDEAWDHVGPALDAVAAAGWPAPRVDVLDPASADPDDPVAAAMLQPKFSTR